MKNTIQSTSLIHLENQKLHLAQILNQSIGEGPEKVDFRILIFQIASTDDRGLPRLEYLEDWRKIDGEKLNFDYLQAKIGKEITVDLDLLPHPKGKKFKIKVQSVHQQAPTNKGAEK